MKAALLLTFVVGCVLFAGFALGVAFEGSLPSYHGACLQVTDTTQLCLGPTAS